VGYALAQFSTASGKSRNDFGKFLVKSISPRSKTRLKRVRAGARGVSGRKAHGRKAHGRKAHGRKAHGRKAHGRKAHGRKAHGRKAHGRALADYQAATAATAANS
jgi:hypothetical protein